MTDESAKRVVLDLDAIESDDHRTMGDVVDAARRIKEGLPVSDSDRAAVARFQESAQRTMTQITARHAETFAQIGAAFESMRRQFGQVFGTLQTVGAAIAPVLVEIGAAVRELPPRLERAVVALANHGWYVDSEHDLHDLWSMQTWIDAGETAKVDEHLVDHFERRLDAIEAELVVELPKRAKILRSAFAAHRRGEYELSVPVLLTQADGACIDLTDHHFFLKTKNSKLSEVASYIDGAQDQSGAMFLEAVKVELPILASEKDRQRIAADRGWATWTELNRHQVLHGESVDYGTRLNSLKGVSLLSYLVNFLPNAAEAAAQAEAGGGAA